MLVLVAYGSTRGGTAGLAHMVADAFAIRGISTDVRRAGDIRDLDDADAVVVGGALYSNRWHPDAVAFVGRHRAALHQLPVWFFSSGPLDDSARSGALAAVPQVSGLAREIDIRGHVTFGGLLDQRPSGLLGVFSWGPEGDFRDSQQVAEWVARIADELKVDGASMVRVIESAPKPPPLPAPAKIETPVRVDCGPELDRPREVITRKRSKLRHYLKPDDDEDDEGLELFAEYDDS